ncbi:MAG: CHC2 zinc finger domain-containing protein, partial [bacterium]
MNIFQAVKNETNIVDVYQDLTGNSVSGINKNVNCPSPGHIDKTPSCKLYPDTNSFNCFGLGCNAGGSVIDMVQQVQGTSPLEAAQWLADRYSIQYEDLTPEAKEQIQKRQTRKEIMTSFIEKSHKRLTAEHRNLLHTRGLSDETIDTYKIGYCPRFTRDQVKDLKNNNPEKYQDHKLIGLINDNDSFIPGDRIIIPFWRYNEPIYWVSWDNNQSDYKYLNPAGMEKPVIFHIANNDNAVYITEGVFDFYSLVEAGKNVIA